MFIDLALLTLYARDCICAYTNPFHLPFHLKSKLVLNHIMDGVVVELKLASLFDAALNALGMLSINSI